MTRSMKKHPYGSYYTCESDRPFKQQIHRRERRRVRQLLHTDLSDEKLPHPKEFGDVEDFGKGRKVFVPKLQSSGWDMSLRELLRWVRK